MGYRFLRKDYDALVAKIEELGHDMWESGREKGLWANQSAETWQDNFGYEQEQQHQWALSERAEDLVQMKNEAEIVERRVPGEVDIGSRVTIEEIEGGELKSFVVGSYRSSTSSTTMRSPMPPRSPSRSWVPPVGEEREVTIGDRTILFRVVGIQ